MPGPTLPAESRPSINIRTSCSLLQRIRDDSEEKREDKERPMAGASERCGKVRRKGEVLLCWRGDRLTYALALEPAPPIDSDQCRLCNQGSACRRVRISRTRVKPASTIASARRSLHQCLTRPLPTRPPER